MAVKVAKRRATAKPRTRTRMGAGSRRTLPSFTAAKPMGSSRSSRPRTRTGRAKGGTRTVTRSRTRVTPSLSHGAGHSTQRKATVKTRGGLTRTARVSKTTTGSGAGRVTKTRRVIVRHKNGRTVKRVVTRVNRGGNVTTSSRVKVSGKGPRSTTPRPTPRRTPSAPRVAKRAAAKPQAHRSTAGLSRNAVPKPPKPRKHR